MNCKFVSIQGLVLLSVRVRSRQCGEQRAVQMDKPNDSPLHDMIGSRPNDSDLYLCNGAVGDGGE